MSQLTLDVTNIGGVQSESLTLDSGVTLLAGPNASNKTSLLTALAFAVGRDEAPMRTGAERAAVTLTIDGTTVERQLSRDGTTTRAEGDSLLDLVETDTDTTAALAEFIALLEFNDLRAAVRMNDPVEPLLKAPVDLETLERRQQQALSRKQEVSDRIDQLEGTQSELADRRAELAECRERREELQADLDALRAQRRDTGDTSDELDRLRDRRATLRARRDEFETDVHELETSVNRLEEEFEDTERELAAATEAVAEFDPEGLRAEREEIRSRLDAVDERIQTLQGVLTANREMLASNIDLLADRERSLTDKKRRCWTCGSAVPKSAFDDAIDDLQTMLSDERAKRREWEPRLEEIEAELDAYRDAKRTRSQIEDRQRDLESKLERRRESLATKRESLQDLKASLQDVEAEIDEQHREQSEANTELADDIEATQEELYRTRNEIERLESTVETLEDDLATLEHLREERSELQTEITDLTDRIGRTEQRLRESFNSAMDELMEVLAFEAIERVWLDGEFQLVVAREVDGTVQRSPVTHLSESEREAIGLVLCLAGYLAYDLDEVSPLLLLDSLGAFDAERLAAVIEFFADRTEYLLVAVYPELGADLPFQTYQVAEAASHSH